MKSTVSGAVPLTGAAEKSAVGGAAGATGALSQLAETAGGLPGIASAFSKLGLKPEMVAKAIPVLTSFVTKSGGAGVGSLLSGVLK